LEVPPHLEGNSGPLSRSPGFGTEEPLFFAFSADA